MSKNNTQLPYYFYQLFGHTITFIVLSKFGSDAFKLASRETLSALILTLSIGIIAHVIIRPYFHQQQSDYKRSYLGLIRIIAIAALAMSLVDLVKDQLLPIAEKSSDHFFHGKGAIIEFIGTYLGSLVFLSAWSFLYFAITSMRDKKAISQQLKEQQLASLINQINPHFLFNSLNTIRGMIYEDQDKAAELVTQLSSLFRYNLSTNLTANSLFKDELEICQQYLAIEQIRLEKRLTVELDISPECMNVNIPTMGLLTLVENAIKHGIAPLKQGGVLTIKARIDNGSLKVFVNNPFDPAIDTSGTKLGIKNLSQRIELMFAKQAKLTQTSNNETYYSELVLPYESN